jgi:hypothetical protein
MRFTFQASDLVKGLSETEGQIAQSVTDAMRAVTEGLKTDLRADVVAAGLGQRLANTWRGRTFPEGRVSIGAAAFVWSKAPNIIDAFDRGAVIRSSRGFFLAIPTAAAGATGRGLSGKRERITPGGWERRTGMRLRFVYRRGGPALLVADNVRLSRQGLAKANTGRSRSGAEYTRMKDRVTAVIFILVPQVTMPKLLNVQDVAARWANRVPGLLVQFWR